MYLQARAYLKLSLAGDVSFRGFGTEPTAGWYTNRCPHHCRQLKKATHSYCNLTGDISTTSRPSRKSGATILNAAAALTTIWPQ